MRGWGGFSVQLSVCAVHVRQAAPARGVLLRGQSSGRARKGRKPEAGRTHVEAIDPAEEALAAELRGVNGCLFCILEAIRAQACGRGTPGVLLSELRCGVKCQEQLSRAHRWPWSVVPRAQSAEEFGIQQKSKLEARRQKHLLQGAHEAARGFCFRPGCSAPRLQR